jgi:hypothetical protein
MIYKIDGASTYAAIRATPALAEQHVVYQTELLATQLAEARAARRLLQGILLVLILIGIPLVTFCLMFIADNA